MSRGVKGAFFALAVITMGMLALGAFTMSTNRAAGLLLCGSGLALAGAGFVARGRILRAKRVPDA